jgi:hypothetical protein
VIEERCGCQRRLQVAAIRHDIVWHDHENFARSAR